MKNKLLFILGIFFLFSLIYFSQAISLSTPSVCCQQTIDGGKCINTEQSKCDTAFSIVPTSCESTSFCKLGTCYDSKEGVCMENVPQTVCSASNGTWSEKKANELAQCQLGCCVVGDQAALVTLTKCKALSTFYGMETDYRPEITNEFSCIEEANSQDEGACVYFDGSVNQCEFTTRKLCNGVNSVLALNVPENPLSQNINERKFYKDVLCSAEELGTVCARQTETKCYKGDVYFFDSCGNRENVYNSNLDLSWSNGRAVEPEQICGPFGQNKDCGNCDFLLGSRCDLWDGFLGIGKPSNSNYFCKTTSCVDREGNTRKNGESWCVYDTEVGNGKDPAGSRHYREVCRDGQVQVEACEDFRNQVCIHSGISTTEGEFSTAACRVNRWQDCTQQIKKDSCENTDQRDCLWIEAVPGINFTAFFGQQDQTQAFSNPTASPSSGSSTTQDAFAALGSLNSLGSTGAFNNGATTANAVRGFFTGYAINYNLGSGVGQWEENELDNGLRTRRTDNQTGLCVPMVSPGFDFWNQNTNAGSLCSLASAKCDVTFERTLTKDPLTGDTSNPDYTCRGNCECLGLKEGDKISKAELKNFDFRNADWAVRANAVCSALGDCGADFNINGAFTDDGYEWSYRNETLFFTQAEAGKIGSQSLGKGTGQVIALDYIINERYQLNQEDYVYVKQ